MVAQRQHASYGKLRRRYLAGSCRTAIRTIALKGGTLYAKAFDLDEPGATAQVEHPQVRLIAAQRRSARIDRQVLNSVADLAACLRRLRALSWQHDAIPIEHVTEFEDILAALSVSTANLVEAVRA